MILVLDTTRLQLVTQNKTQAKAMLAVFFAVAEEKLALLKCAHDDEFRAQSLEIAHYLKGSAANLGMQILAECCKQAEMQLPAARDKMQWIEAIANELRRIRTITDGMT